MIPSYFGTAQLPLSKCSGRCLLAEPRKPRRKRERERATPTSMPHACGFKRAQKLSNWFPTVRVSECGCVRKRMENATSIVTSASTCLHSATKESRISVQSTDEVFREEVSDLKTAMVLPQSRLAGLEQVMMSSVIRLPLDDYRIDNAKRTDHRRDGRCETPNETPMKLWTHSKHKTRVLQQTSNSFCIAQKAGVKLFQPFRFTKYRDHKPPRQSDRVLFSVVSIFVCDKRMSRGGCWSKHALACLYKVYKGGCQVPRIAVRARARRFREFSVLG